MPDSSFLTADCYQSEPSTSPHQGDKERFVGTRSSHQSSVSPGPSCVDKPNQGSSASVAANRRSTWATSRDGGVGSTDGALAIEGRSRGRPALGGSSATREPVFSRRRCPHVGDARPRHRRRSARHAWAANQRRCCSARARGQDVVEVLRKRQADRRLEEARRLGVDDRRAVRGEERRDLLLGAQGDRPKSRGCRVLVRNPCGFVGSGGFSAKARSWR